MSRIGRLTASIAVPDQGDLPLGTLDRVGTAVTERIPAALTKRFAVEPDSDVSAGRPVVVIRRLEVSAPVPATASADEIAERLADRLTRAIRTAPPETVVRYPSRAAHIAAFVAALSSGTGDSWVFESFSGVRLLAPLTALCTLAERYAAPVVAVLGALHDAGDLMRVLIRASAAELTCTWAECLALPHPPMTAAVAEAHLESGPVDDTPQPALPSREGVALVLVARAFTAGGAAAVAVSVAATLVTSPVVRWVPLVRDPAGAAGSPAVAGSVGSGHRETEPSVVEAAGAPAFLLLSSFEKVGLAELVPLRRAQVLAAATRTSVADPAVVLASGLDRAQSRSNPRPEQQDSDPAAGLSGADHPGRPSLDPSPPAVLGVVQQALIDDDRLGLERLVTFSSGAHVVVADAWSEIWLAILSTGEPVKDALIPALAGLPVSAAEPDDTLRARIVSDLHFLLPDEPAPVSRAVAVAARAGLGHFARRLGGFGASSLPYLSDRFLTPGGVIADLDESLWVRLPAPPLLVVLALAGMDRTTVQATWLDRPVTITHEDPA